MTDCLWRSLPIKALHGFKFLLPPSPIQVTLTLTTKMMESYHSKKSGTYFFPQKSMDVAWGKPEQGIWGLGLLSVGGRDFLRGVRTESTNQCQSH